jgi:hypothetical protein
MQKTFMGDLKGQCHEIFRLINFCHQTTSPGLNGHVQKRFRCLSNIRGVICIHNCLSGDDYTGESIRSFG